MSMTGVPSKASNGRNPNSIRFLNLQHFYAVQADGIRPIRRARRKYSSKRFVRITPRVNPEQVAPPPVKPCQNEYITPNSNAIERICKMLDKSPATHRAHLPIPVLDSLHET